jgi:hypothetical protein
MADPKNFKTNSEKLSELKVRVYGNAAVATYKDTYDIMIMGQRRAHTIIATDTFVKTGDEHFGIGRVAQDKDIEEVVGGVVAQGLVNRFELSNDPGRGFIISRHHQRCAGCGKAAG